MEDLTQEKKEKKEKKEKSNKKLNKGSLLGIILIAIFSGFWVANLFINVLG